MGINNNQLRVETKNYAKKLLQTGQMEFVALACALAAYNNWTRQTNYNIIKEMVGGGILEQKRNIVFLKELGPKQ